MIPLRRCSVGILFVFFAGLAAVPRESFGQQIADSAFRPSVTRPAFPRVGPRILFDHAHLNFHRVDATYRPFADLLRADGYRVDVNERSFSVEALADVDVLVIVNARGAEGAAAFDTPAFTEQECTTVREWVRSGGALLLVADHAPFGAGAEILSQQFGVDMAKGVTIDTATGRSEKNPSFLLFTRENGLLGSHPILRGRDTHERISRVQTFTGQSLSVPPGAAALLPLGETALDHPGPDRAQAEARAARRQRLVDSVRKAMQQEMNTVDTVVIRAPASETESARTATPKPAAGRSQGVALTFGRGRVVVLAEAAMLSAQVVAIPGQPEHKMGMNVQGIDDQQFVLNVMHWLSRVF